MEAATTHSQTVLDTITHRIERVNTLVNSLPSDTRRWFDAIPDRCWMTAENQAKMLKVRKSKIADYKETGRLAGVVNVELHPNGKRHMRDCRASKRPELHFDCNPPVFCVYNNFKHVVQKTGTLLTTLKSTLSSDSSFVSDESLDYDLVNPMDWELLKSYKPDELNRMSKVELVQFYQNVGFLVLPTAYIVFENLGGEKIARCSCWRWDKGIQCKSPGKHPIHGYKFLTPTNYPKYAAKYLEEFRDNPSLNPGAKVFGYSLLDADGRNSGFETYQQLQLQSWTLGEFELAENLKIKTPGGFHLIVENEAIGNHADFFGRGVDVRSERGFHVLPGAIHKSGAKYEWEKIEGNPSRIPASWFFEPSENSEDKSKISNSRRTYREASHMNQRAKMRAIVVKDEERKMKEGGYVIPKGFREPTLFKFAARERAFGRDVNHILDVITTIRDTYCEDGHEIEDGDLTRIAEHVCEYPTNADKLNKFKSSRHGA